MMSVMIMIRIVRDCHNECDFVVDNATFIWYPSVGIQYIKIGDTQKVRDTFSHMASAFAHRP